MRVAFNKKGLGYISKLALFSVIFTFLSSFSSIFLLGFVVCSFSALGIAYAFRDPDVNFTAIEGVISPADGKVCEINQNSLEEKEIVINCGVVDKYTKYSPIEGQVVNITVFNSLNSDFSGGVELEIKNNAISTRIVISCDKMIVNENVELYVHVGDEIRKGERICIAPFASFVRVYLPGTINIFPVKNQEILAGEQIGV